MGDEERDTTPPAPDCAVCREAVLPEDPTYPEVHLECSKTVYREMQDSGVIEILSQEGTRIAFALTQAFEEALAATMSSLRSRIVNDETVEDDLVTLQAVMSAVDKYYPDGTSRLELSRSAMILFNSLMAQKYGIPVPPSRRYHARVKEFREEVIAIPTTAQGAERFRDSMKCPCKSGNEFGTCCKRFFSILGLPHPLSFESDTLLFAWLDRYSLPIAQSFRLKANPTVFRISVSLDRLVEQYFRCGFRGLASDTSRADEIVLATKNNILHSIYGSLSCLSQGLLVQSGTILRSMMEDCLVLLDISENAGQIDRLLRGNYSSKGLIQRVQRLVPKEVVSWYGYFSANFTHFGPLHPAPYLPAACYPNNSVLVLGLQDVVRGLVTFHAVLERLYIEQTVQPVLWKRVGDAPYLVFDDESPVFTWAAELGRDLKARCPIDDEKRESGGTGRRVRLK